MHMPQSLSTENYNSMHKCGKALHLYDMFIICISYHIIQKILSKYVDMIRPHSGKFSTTQSGFNM